MSSAAAKKAAKRRAKKEEAQAQAALSAMEAVTASMAAPEVTSSAAAASASPPAPTSSDPRVQLKEAGNRAFLSKNMAEAVRLFTEAIDAPVSVDTDAQAAESAAAHSLPAPPPFLASVYSNRSAAYAAVYEWAAALHDASKAIEIAPKWSKGYYRQGQAYEGMMKFDRAAAAYQAGLGVDRTDSVLKRQLESVQQMLSEMSHSKTTSIGSLNPEEDKFDRMIQWLLGGKSRFPSLYLKYYSDEYRGVHALTRVPKDDIVLEVPLSHIMTSEVAKASPIGQQITASGIVLNSTHTYLSCYLLQEKNNPNSFWKPYIDILPQTYRNMPIFFNEEELAYLKGSFTLGKIADRHAELKEEYDNLVSHIPSFGSQFTLQDFVWARTVVITRIFGLIINGGKTDGLVPMADMLNHKRPRETSWTYDDERGAFTITALRPIGQGEQIYDSYGRKCNSRFFVNYGFSLENNELDNQCVMWFTLPTSDPHYATKVRLLNGQKLSLAPNQPKRVQISIDYAEDNTRECFSFLRFVHAKDGELLLLSSSDRFDVRKIEPISLRNELEVVQDLAIAASTSLSQFENSIEEDDKLLADPNLPPNIRNCVLMRRGEKQVLQYYIDLVEAVRPLTEMHWKDVKKYVAKANKGHYDAYIQAVIMPLIKANH